MPEKCINSLLFTPYIIVNWHEYLKELYYMFSEKEFVGQRPRNQCLYVVTSYHCLTKINSEENRDFIVHIGMLFYFTNWFLIIKGGRQKWNTIGHNKKDMKNQFLYKLGFINGDVHRNIHQTRHLHCAHVSSDNDLCHCLLFQCFHSPFIISFAIEKMITWNIGNLEF